VHYTEKQRVYELLTLPSHGFIFPYESGYNAKKHMTEYIKNKKASFDYEWLEEYEAGAVLSGHEVKAIRTGKASLNGAYVVIRGGEAFLVNASISPYQAANTPKGYDPERARKLLLSRKQLTELELGSEKQGLTIVAIKWYNKGSKLKLHIALARGKKKADKRETLKERDIKREIDRLMKSY
jgi:SsrA-binding protein